MRDGIEVTRSDRMEPDAADHVSRAATVVVRAATKASSRSMNADRDVSIRGRISCARAERATWRSYSSCIICSSAAATAAL
jgi:hypothetical protein